MSDLSAFPKGQEVAAYVRRLLVEHPKETVAARLWEHVRSSSELPTEIARELVRLEGPAELRAAIARGEFPPLTDLAAAATSVLRGEPVTDEETEALLSAPRADLDLSAMLFDRTEYVPWGGGDGHHLQSLLDSPALRLDPRVHEQIDRLVDGPNREKALRAELMTAYQSFAMRHRGLAVNDPRTGEQASYLGYLLNADIVAYRFGGEADPGSDFYLLARGPAGRLRSAYLPDEDLLLDLSAGGLPILPRWPSVKALLARVLLAHAGRNRARPSDPARRSEAELTIRVGGANNFAHVLWNYYGGLAREAELGTLSSAQKVLLLGSEFFGPPTELYPEIASAQITQRARAGTFGRHIDDPHQLLIPLGSTLLWPGVIDRVASRAETLRDDPVVADLLEQMRACPIRLYVGLRVWDKSWVDAAEQLPLLIERLLRSHPDACVMLDGFSVPSGVDYATMKWTDQQAELGELVDTVRSRVAEPARVLDLMGLDLLRSITVLRGATCYLCPAGTAHHKIEWFTDIPGIVYVSEQLMQHGKGVRDASGKPASDSLPGRRVRKASHEPRIVVGQDTDAADVRVQRVGDRRSNLANFTLSWNRVWDELAPLLESLADDDSEGSDAAHPAPQRPASDGLLSPSAPRLAEDSLPPC
jgi:hypothetical protein